MSATTFDIVNEIGAHLNSSFLVIGGHAINAYGYSRFTRDIDILIDQAHKPDWLTALKAKGFNLYHDGGAFLQIGPPPNSDPLDLMLVNAATFEKLSVGAKTVNIRGINMRAPSLENLFALKFHVLQQDIPHRGFKDFLDILALADCNGIDLRSDKIRELCEKFGSKKSMSDSLPSKDELREAAVAYRPGKADFELPSSSYSSSSPMLTPTEYVAWCEEMKKALNLPQDEPARRLALKTSKEFVF